MTTKEGERIDRLSELLFAIPRENYPMTISELDGYLTGVLACPEMISPSEWLPRVWGETVDAQFPNQKAAEETINAVMQHYNSVASVMTRSLGVEPIYEIDSNSDETLWEPWVDGYSRSMTLRPKAWTKLFDQADEEARHSMIFLMALQDIYTGKSKFSEDEIATIDDEAPFVIPKCLSSIIKLSRPELFSRRAANLPGMPHKAAVRPGRNDPCTCGSGRKYKQFCGAQ